MDLGALRAGYVKRLHPIVSKSRYYPKKAKRLGLECRVVVALLIDARGSVRGVKLHRGCEHAMLNDAAVDAMRRVRRLPAPPASVMGARKTMRVNVPLTYSLRDAR